MSLAARIEALYARLKDFPETHTPAGPVLKPDAFAAFMELRQLMEREVIPALRRIEAYDDEMIAIPRLSYDQSKR